MDPQQKAIADEFDRYDQTYKDTVNGALRFSGLKVDFFTRVKAEYLLEVLQEKLGAPAGLRLLDVGCGIGNYHPLLRHRVGPLSGVDISAACIERAAAANPEVAYAVYDGLRLPYADASFDAAFTICVLHHVPPAQWPAFAAEMARVIKPGGLALVFEHNPRNPLTMRVVDRCPFDRDAVLLRAETAVDLMRTAGLEDVAARYILSLPAGTRWLRAVDRRFASLPFGAQYYVAARRPPEPT